MNDIVTLNGLVAAGGVWARAGEGEEDFAYSDGTAQEAYVLEVVQGASDLSSLSEALDGRIRDWPSEYHLSSQRANLLRPFDYSGMERVLELGCGCGAITRFLGEQGLAVDAVEGSPQRARIAALRCRDLPGVRVIRSNFNALELPDAGYDAVFLIGVLEYAKRFHPQAATPEAAVQAILQRVARALGPGGRVFIAIENRLGFKYIQGATEDHYGVPHVGLSGYPAATDIKTFSLGEWRAMLDAGDWQRSDCYLAFPDYKLCSVLMSESFAGSGAGAAQLLAGVHSRDYLRALPQAVDEAVFWRAAAEAGQVAPFANAFLWVLRRPGGGGGGEGIDFAVCGGHLRKRRYRVMAWKPAAEARVLRRRLAGGGDGPGWLRQRVEDEPYLRGRLLAEVWADGLRREEGLGALLERVAAYRAYLEALATRRVPLYDALPGNIMVMEDGALRVFDTEWVVEDGVSPAFVLFRGLLYFAAAHARLLRPLFQEHGLRSLEGFVVHCAEAAGCPMREQILGFSRLEERIQGEILRVDSGSRIRQLLKADLSQEGPGAFYHPRLYWGGDEADLEEGRSQRLSAGGGRGVQRLEFQVAGPQPPIHVLRFDPSEETGFFKLHRIEVARLTGREARPWGRWQAAELGAARWGNVVAASGPLGEAYYAQTEDPHLWLPLAEPVALGPGESLRVVVEMEWLGAREHLLIRSEYARRNRQLEQALDALGAERDVLLEAKAELELVKRSRVWRLAEALRRGLYQRLLGRTPRLRAGLLAASRRGFKASLRRWARRLLGRAPAEPAAVEAPPATPQAEYEQWQRRQPPVKPDAVRAGIAALRRRPKISIVMPVFNTDPRWLARALASVRGQYYDNWELCIADDASTDPATIRYLKHVNDPKIKIVFREAQGGISRATNDALAQASGDYVAFMDHDDELAPEALYEVVRHLDQHDDDIVYTDEDFIDPDGSRVNPHFKPDWSPDLLLSHNYMTHLLVVRRSLVEALGGLRPEYDGAQDYDFLLRATERTGRIGHVPKILYHWRRTAQSTSLNADAKPLAHRHGEAALRAALERRGIAAEVLRANKTNFYRVKRRVDEAGGPRVSIVIPFKDEPELLDTCLASILEKTNYRNYEVLGISNNSVRADTFEVMQRFGADGRVRFVEHNRPFNFAELVNAGVAAAEGEHIVLLNNDIEIISWEWLTAMLEHSQRPEVGVVGGKLYYPDNTVQHAGIIIGLGGYAGHSHKHFRADETGYFNRLNLIQNVSAVTGACMMFSRQVYDRLGDSTRSASPSPTTTSISACGRWRRAI